MPDQAARYVVLSYCWNVLVPDCSTALDKLKKKNCCGSDIPLGSFPQTFKDAVEIARLLGIKYLWIDSMCIIQDGDQGKD
jgi:hypothetical protein